MDMTPHQIRIVKQSFAAVAPQRERVAALFFASLFDIDPTLRLLFPGDLRRQGAKLMHAAELIVGELHRLHVFVPALEALAVRHVGYGLEQSHYAVVGEALMRTARAALGDRFTAEVEDAIAAAYAELSETMIHAVREDWPLAA
jgi:hemoglobin-like flavoprotein